MTTGARRGELCALRWSHVDLANGTVTFRRGIAQDGTVLWEKDTKTHQQRRVTIDPETVAVLTEHWDRSRSRAAALGLTLGRGAFVFSNAPDASTHLVPSSVTQRYNRLAHRLSINTHLHALRHFSATELIAAGVDVRTVACRLGHSGGGITTLRVDAAWLAESDQRAAGGLLARMPTRHPLAPSEPNPIPGLLGRGSPSSCVTASWLANFPSAGGYLPGIKQLSARYGVAASTAHRAVVLLKDWGMIDGEPGQRAKVLGALVPVESAFEQVKVELETARGAPGGRQLLDLEVRRAGQIVARLTAEADPRSADDLRRLLVGSIRRSGEDPSKIADYEMDIRSGDQLLITFVVF
jgi:hypothetical protein